VTQQDPMSLARPPTQYTQMETKGEYWAGAVAVRGEAKKTTGRWVYLSLGTSWDVVNARKFLLATLM